MRLFESAQKNFEMLGIGPNQSRLNRRILVAFTCYWFDNILNCVFLVREVNSFSETVNSIFITSGTTTIAMVFTILVINMTKLFNLVHKAEEMADQAIEMNPASKDLYETTIRQIAKWNRIVYIFIANVCPFILILPKLITSFFIYFTSDLGEEAFALPTPTWFPIDSKNPVGYVITVLLEYGFTVYMLAFLGSLATLGVAAFLFQITIIKDIKDKVNLIEENSKLHGDRLQIFKHVSDFIEIDSIKRQIVHEFSEVCGPFFVVVFISSLVMICVSLLLIQTDLSQLEVDFVVLLMATVYLWVSLGMVFVVCELAQRGCDAFNNIDELLVQWTWYAFPNGVQRMLPLIMIVVHQMVEIKCFGSISCNRESFKIVLNKAYSSFMLLRHFSK